jgi:NADPH:quinone reductase
MKAAYYDQNGKAAEVLEIGDLSLPDVSAGEVRVKVHASGVNPSDVKSRAGLTRRMAFPRVIPHSDGAGVIDAVGTGVPTDRIGQRVWTYNAQFGRPFGTAAQYVTLPADLAVPLPDNVSFAEGACLGIPVQTAHAAVFADGPVHGKTLLVQGGAGAVGHYAIQFAKWGGARVIATVSSAEKAQHAAQAGADAIINYRDEDVLSRVKEITAGKGVDQVIEVEFGANLPTDLQILAQGGSIAIYGSQQNMEPVLPVGQIWAKCLRLNFVLVYNLPPDRRSHALRDIATVLEAGKLVHRIATRLPLSRIVDAHIAQESGRTIGNIILDVG